LKYKTVFTTPFFDIEAGIESILGTTAEPYYRMTGSDSVICCAMTVRGEFVMIKQYRPNIERFTLELPAGGIANDENPVDAARREFAEETSLKCEFVALGDFKLMMNRTNIREHIFFGLNPSIDPCASQESGIEVVFVKRTELIEYSLAGGYKQLAGLGVIQLASNYLGLDILREPMDVIFEQFNMRVNYEG